jgi:YVTN family beta-propeller protein
MAISPNGQTVYVVDSASVNGGSGTVTPIPLRTEMSGNPITVGSGPDAIAITPNGQTAYVVNGGSGTVTPITIATGTAGTPITVGTDPEAIAITPDGQTAYVVTSGGTIIPITIATNTAGTPIDVGNGATDIAITPDGQTAYVTSENSNTVTPVTIATNTAGTPITVGNGPAFIAITAGTVGTTDNGSGSSTDNGSQANVTSSVTAGDRTAVLAGAIAFPAVDASHGDVDAVTQTTSVEVNDLTASDAGWDVTVLVSDLTGSLGGTIAADNLSVASYGALTVATGDTAGVTTNIVPGTPGPIGTTTGLLSAPVGYGVGDYTQEFDVALVVPANSLAGDYAGTLTVTIAPAGA